MSKHKITLGYILSKYRVKSKLDIDKLAYKISTDVDYIIALEKGNYKVFKTLNQAIPIIRKLSYVFGLKYQNLVDLYNKEYESYWYSKKNHNNTFKLIINHSILRLGIGVFIGIFMISYLILQIYQIRYSPSIILSNQSNYQIYDQDQYKLEGQLSRADKLTLNGQKVTIKEDGKFEIILNLRQGENRLELIAQKNNKLLKTIQKTIYKK
jgi:hypothetical protein